MLYKWAIKQKKNNRIISSSKDNGSDVVELDIPSLMNIIKHSDSYNKER
jgi:hypothetical protein